MLESMSAKNLSMTVFSDMVCAVTYTCSAEGSNTMNRAELGCLPRGWAMILSPATFYECLCSLHGSLKVCHDSPTRQREEKLKEEVHPRIAGGWVAKTKIIAKCMLPSTQGRCQPS